MEVTLKDVISNLVSLQFSPKLENLQEIKCMESEIFSNLENIDQMLDILSNEETTDKEVVYTIQLLKKSIIFWKNSSNFNVARFSEILAHNAKKICRNDALMYSYSRLLALSTCLHYFCTTEFIIPNMELSPVFLHVLIDVLDIIQNEKIPNLPTVELEETEEEKEARMNRTKSLINSKKKRQEKVFEYVPFFISNYLGNIYRIALDSLVAIPDFAIDLLNNVLLFSKNPGLCTSITIPGDILDDFIKPLPNDNIRRDIFSFLKDYYLASQPPLTTQIISLMCTIIRATSHHQIGSAQLITPINNTLIEIMKSSDPHVFNNTNELTKCIKACNFVSTDNDNAEVVNQIIEMCFRFISEDAADNIYLIKTALAAINRITSTYPDNPFIDASKDISKQFIESLLEQAKTSPSKVEENVLVDSLIADKLMALVWENIGDDAIMLIDAQFSFISPKIKEKSNIVLSSLLFYFVKSIIINKENFSSAACIASMAEKVLDYTNELPKETDILDLHEIFLLSFFESFFESFNSHELFEDLVPAFSKQITLEDFVHVVLINCLEMCSKGGKQAADLIANMCKYEEIQGIMTNSEEMHAFIDNIFVGEACEDSYVIAALFSFVEPAIKAALLSKMPGPTKNAEDINKYFMMQSFLFRATNTSDWISYCSSFFSNWNGSSGWMSMIKCLVEEKKMKDPKINNMILRFIINTTRSIPSNEPFPTRSKYGFLFFKCMFEICAEVTKSFEKAVMPTDTLMLVIESIDSLIRSPIGNIGICVLFQDYNISAAILGCVRHIYFLNSTTPELSLVIARFIGTIAQTCQFLLNFNENIIPVFTWFLLTTFDNPSQELMDAVGYALISLMGVCFSSLGPHYIMAIDALTKIDDIRMLGCFINAYTEYNAEVTIEISKRFQLFFTEKELMKKAKVLCNYLFKDIEDEPNYLEEFKQECKNFGISFTSIRSICELTHVAKPALKFDQDLQE